MAGTGKAHLRPERQPMLTVENLVVEFPAGRGRRVHAVSGVSFDVLDGETLGVVGESGCGKTSAGRAIIQLPPPTSGLVELDGVELTALSGEDLRRTRPRLQIILQDSIASLNPRRSVADTVSRGLKIWKPELDDNSVSRQVDEVLEAVGLDPALMGPRRPHQLSGGQAQRVCIARSLLLEPKLLICDEPVSALDVSVQAQILNLMEDMQTRYGLTTVFISHDLGVVKNVSDRVIVMYLGKVCEVGPPDSVYANAAHHYAQRLIDSIPVAVPADRSQVAVAEREADVLPSPIDPPSGCRYRTRCAAAQDRCTHVEPELRKVGDDHFVACHFPRRAVC